MNNAAAADHWLMVDTETEAGTNTVVQSRSSGGLGDIYIIISDIHKVENVI
jgi:hypothetical protein